MATHKEGNLDMNALLKASREQHSERQNKPVQTRKPPGPAAEPVKVINSSADVANAQHGEYVQTADGYGAIVVDHEEQIKKMQENDKTGKTLLALVDSSTLISDANDYVPDYGEEAPEGYNPGEQWITENPYDPKARTLVDIKKGFSELTFGINGLVDANSDEGRSVNEAMEKLRSGEIVLPTPEEYEQQKAEAAERRKQRQERLANQNKEEAEKKKEESKPSNVSIEPTIEEPKMAEMPEHAIMKKGAIEQMSEIVTMNPTTGNQRQGTPVSVAVQEEKKTEERVAVKPVQTPEATNVVESNVPTKPTPNEEPQGLLIDTPEPENKATGPLNLGALEDEMEEANASAGEQKKEEEKKDPNTPEVLINVPEGGASDVIQALPLSTYDKIVRSKSIQVNEIEKKDVPVATRRITNIADYRALANRRKASKDVEITERVLVNSGLIITLKSATSLEMATIFKSVADSETDWSKMYSFVYEHHTGTSIGKLSYNDFVQKISPSDIETCLDGIYEISETDERKVQLNCGIGDGGCGAPYEVTIKPATLPCVDRLPEASKNRVKEIVSVRNNIEEARKVQESSPTMMAKYVQFGDRTLCVRSTTGHMIIERNDQLENITVNYNALIALLVLYVESIKISYSVREDAAPEVIEIDAVDLICEELKTLNDVELEELKQIIAEGLNDYEPVKYSLKGTFRCPNCGNTKTEVDCNISDLIFQKVQRMLE
jgi:hypothetical protein